MMRESEESASTANHRFDLNSNKNLNHSNFTGFQIGQNVLIPQSAVYPHKQVVVSLEGKSSLVVYESADLDSAIETIVDGCFYSNGQVTL